MTTAAINTSNNEPGDSSLCTTAAATTKFLILGDGDFTFSYDFARFLLQQSSSSSSSSNNTTSLVASASANVPSESAINQAQEGERIHLIATGFDSIPELTGKYRDAPFILRRLQDISLSSRHDHYVQISIQHGVNAIRTAPTNVGDDDDDDDEVNNRNNNNGFVENADYVIFNHPHLGTEDAQLHSRFLCHLFHSVQTVWLMRRGGYFHLTLAEGQFERWGCIRAAERYGMVMVDRSIFRPPPVASAEEGKKKQNNTTNYYTLRRHQTGRSFRSRATGKSETFTFARKQDVVDNNQGRKASRPIWIMDPHASSSSPISPREAFPCPFCERTFREKRSVKAHVQSKHPCGNKTSEVEKDAYYVCPHCKSDDHDENGSQHAAAGTVRTFESLQALEDHIRAKHTAQHRNIQPDWCTQPKLPAIPSRDGADVIGRDEEVDRNHYYGVCDICGLVFHNQSERFGHLKSFEPECRNNGMGTTESKSSHKCQFCNKRFRERRAQLQHENVCPSAT